MGQPLTDWLELMLAEIAQREQQARADAEEHARRQVDAPVNESADVRKPDPLPPPRNPLPPRTRQRASAS